MHETVSLDTLLSIQNDDHHEDGPGQVPLLALLQRQQARLEQPQQQAAHLHELTLCISEKNVTEMCIWSWLIFYIYCNLLYCVFIKTKLIKNVTFRLVISHAIHQFYFFFLLSNDQRRYGHFQFYCVQLYGLSLNLFHPLLQYQCLFICVFHLFQNTVLSIFLSNFKGRYLQHIQPDRSNRAFSYELCIVFNGDTPKYELANSSLRREVLT